MCVIVTLLRLFKKKDVYIHLNEFLIGHYIKYAIVRQI